MNFGGKEDAQIESWARKFEENKLTDDPRYSELVRERTRRRQTRQKLDFGTSLEHLKRAAIAREFTSYGQLAAASGVDWKNARHQINGAHGHLDTLLDICHTEGLPLLTAICVNQQNLHSGKLSEDALEGFVEGAKRLGISLTSAESFHEECVRKCFEWGENNKRA